MLVLNKGLSLLHLGRRGCFLSCLYMATRAFGHLESDYVMVGWIHPSQGPK